MTDRDKDIDRHPAADELLDLALSDLDGPRRDELTRHLALCEPCRAEFAALADAVDHAVVAAPRVDPPPGFSHSVLTAMGISGTAMGEGAGPVKADGRRALGRRWSMALLAAAVVGGVVGVGAAVVLQQGRDQGSPTVVAAVGAPLRTGDGSSVGVVQESWYDGRPVLVVTVSDAPVGARYECRLLLRDGSRVAAGSWVLATGSGTWVVASPGEGAVAGVEMVSDSGTTWATARI